MPATDLHLQPSMSTPLEIAIAVKNLKNINDAARLIELYAGQAVEAAKLDALVEARNRISCGMEAKPHA